MRARTFVFPYACYKCNYTYAINTNCVNISCLFQEELDSELNQLNDECLNALAKNCLNLKR